MQLLEFEPEIPQELLQGEKKVDAVHFTVTENLLENFSTITGDRSHLHMNPDFARRSIYRRQVVHGMLPVSFVSLLSFLHHREYSCIVRQLNCQFIEPVFIGDDLTLQGELVEINEETEAAEIKFTVTKKKNGVDALNGVMQVSYVALSDFTAHIKSTESNTSNTGSVNHNSPEVLELALEEIAVDDTDGFPFILSDQTLSDFRELLIEGLTSEHLQESRGGNFFYLPALLPIMLFSTSVGVYIPGKYATFLAFEASVHGLMMINTPYFLHGKISHVSRGTRILKKDIFITEKDSSPDRAVITGTVKVLVNEPPVAMPKMSELKDTSLNYGLNGKVALITGASRGIGETIAKFLALHGAKVVVNFYRGENDAQRVVEEIEAENFEAISIQADVRDEGQVRKMIDRTVLEYGAIDILVNNAVGDFKPVPFNRLIWDDIQRDIDIVVQGAFNCCKEVVPHMLKKGSGKIINIGTVATSSPPPNQIKYVISKSGLVGLTRSLSVEYAAKNIQVNMVVPSFVETDLVSHIPGVYRKKIAKETPMGRNASPADIAQAVLFLASSYSSFTTGQKILVTGGGPPFS